MNKRLLFWGLLIIIVLSLIYFSPQPSTPAHARRHHPGSEIHDTHMPLTAEARSAGEALLGLKARPKLSWTESRDNLLTQPGQPTESLPTSTLQQTQDTPHVLTVCTHNTLGIHYFGRVSIDHQDKAMLSFKDQVVLLLPQQCYQQYCLSQMDKHTIILSNTHTHKKLTLVLGDVL